MRTPRPVHRAPALAAVPIAAAAQTTVGQQANAEGGDGELRSRSDRTEAHVPVRAAGG